MTGHDLERSPFTAWWWTAFALDNSTFADLARFMGAEVTFAGRQPQQERKTTWISLSQSTRS